MQQIRLWFKDSAQITYEVIRPVILEWETRCSVSTLRQVRWAMPTLLHQLGPPARAPQLRGKAPGRAKGFHPKPRTPHPVIRKTSKKQKKINKSASA